MISYFYWQHSETRDVHYQMSTEQFTIDIKVSIITRNLVINQDQRLNYAQIQSSSISTQFIYNQIANCLNSTN